MTEILNGIKSYLKVKEVSFDNGVFKLFSVGSVILCVAGSLLCAATQFFGTPITCEFDSSVSADFAKQHCWIHGSNWISEIYREEFDCRVSQDGVHDEHDAPDTSYYQWVVFFLLVQAGFFVLPYKVWKTAEKGLVKDFATSDTRSAFLIADEKKSEALIRKCVKEFNCILHHNTRYFTTFVVCEALNVAFLYLNFYATNAFLNGNFSTYGFEVWEYYRTERQLRVHNPMCEAFPTKVSCSLKLVAASGGVSQKNGFCILSQNIVNEKVFLVLYAWYIFLFVVSGAFVIYRLSTLVLPQTRRWLLCSRARGKGMKVAVERILAKCQVGDWFVLYQIGKNVNPYFFREFLKELQHDLNKTHGSKKSKDATAEVSLLKFENDRADGSAETVPMDNLAK